MRSVPRPSSRGAMRGLRRGLARLERRQTPPNSKKQPGGVPGSGNPISLSSVVCRFRPDSTPPQSATGWGAAVRGEFHVSPPREGVSPIIVIPAGRLRGEPRWTTTHGAAVARSGVREFPRGRLLPRVAGPTLRPRRRPLGRARGGVSPRLPRLRSGADPRPYLSRISAFLRRDPGLVLPRLGHRCLRGEPRPRGARRSLFQPRGPRGIRPIPRRRHGGAGDPRSGPELARCVLSGRWHRGLWMGRPRLAFPPARGESDPRSRRSRRSTGLLHDPALVSCAPRPSSLRRRADSLGELACVAGVMAGLSPGRPRWTRRSSASCSAISTTRPMPRRSQLRSDSPCRSGGSLPG